MLRGGTIMSTGNFPDKFESTNPSRDNLSREIVSTRTSCRDHVAVLPYTSYGPMSKSNRSKRDYS